MPPATANSERQRIAVIGLGSIGGVVAGLLGAAKQHDIVACVRRPIERMTVERTEGATESPIPTLTDPSQAQPQDWVLLCTKVQDTASSGPWLQRLCGPKTRVAALQNGIAHAENLAPFVGGAVVIPAIVYYNGERLAPDRVRYRRGGEHDFAVADGADGQAFAALFEGTRLRTLLSRDFKTLAWRKLLVNAVGNPVSALTLRRNAVFLRDDVAALCLALLEEAVNVGRADGAQLAANEAAQTMARLTAIPPDAGSSMYFDRLAGRPLEIDALTGAVVEIAERHRVPTPLLRMLLTLARAASASSAPNGG
ncbi:2-dehydropantoate 2-reductase [Bradyrhizobium sp.]|uniref:2-dehydropantoate 2-reductase n=1 Tax=Bradyrhizobium sp. TaxID=376 RepID=UPI002631D016|nr:2-dehydropantoate 2-reductase [Bradyrhizobium sp.]